MATGGQFQTVGGKLIPLEGEILDPERKLDTAGKNFHHFLGSRSFLPRARTRKISAAEGTANLAGQN